MSKSTRKHWHVLCILYAVDCVSIKVQHIPSPIGRRISNSKRLRPVEIQSCDVECPLAKVCIFAYGQTGSGKTFTMTGTEANPGWIRFDPETVG